MNKKNLLSSIDLNQDIENVSNSERVFSGLPDEILIEIFKCFSFCEMRKYVTVCKRWYDLSWRGSLLESVNIKSKTVPIDILEKILRSGVRKFEILYCELRIPNNSVCFEGQNFSNIRALYMEVYVYGPFETFLKNILRSCLNLQELVIFNVEELDETVFRIILEMKFLQILYIHHDRCKASLNISKCVGKSTEFRGLLFLHICVDCFSDIRFTMIETLIMSAPNLRFLIIKNSLAMDMCTLVSPTFFEQLSMLKHLEVLELPWMCLTSTSDVLDTLKSLKWRTSFNNLKTLSLYTTKDKIESFEGSNLQLHQAFVVNFLKPCLNIETLTLRKICIDDKLILQLSQMKKLKELQIIAFSVDALESSPFEFEDSVELCITTLKIKYVTDLYFTSFVLLLLIYCPKVEFLYLKRSRFTKQMFKRIRVVPSLKRLRLKSLLDEDWGIVFSVFRRRKIIIVCQVFEYTREIEILLQERAAIESE